MQITLKAQGPLLVHTMAASRIDPEPRRFRTQAPLRASSVLENREVGLELEVTL